MDESDLLASPPKVRRVVQVSSASLSRPPSVSLVRQSPIGLQEVPNLSSHGTSVRSYGHPDVSLESSALDYRSPLANTRTSSGQTLPPMIILPQSRMFQDEINLNSVLNNHSDAARTEISGSFDLGNLSSIDLEGKMVDNAIDNVMNLPQAFNEIVEMQKGQNNEIQRQQQLIKTYQEKLKEVLEKKEDLTLEITAVTHKVYMTEEKRRNCKKKCKEYEIEIKKLVQECEEDRNRITELEEDIEQDSRQYNKYRELINKHKKVVEEFESGLEVNKQIKELENAINELQNKNDKNREETDKLISGQMEKDLTCQIRDTQKSLEMIKLLIKEKSDLIQEERSKQEKLQLSLNVLQKKNIAQLTRLKKQVKAGQQRNRQWQDHISQLHKSIEDLNQKLAQDSE